MWAINQAGERNGRGCGFDTRSRRILYLITRVHMMWTKMWRGELGEGGEGRLDRWMQTNNTDDVKEPSRQQPAWTKRPQTRKATGERNTKTKRLPRRCWSTQVSKYDGHRTRSGKHLSIDARCLLSLPPVDRQASRCQRSLSGALPRPWIFYGSVK